MSDKISKHIASEINKPYQWKKCKLKTGYKTSFKRWYGIETNLTLNNIDENKTYFNRCVNSLYFTNYLNYFIMENLKTFFGDSFALYVQKLCGESCKVTECKNGFFITFSDEISKGDEKVKVLRKMQATKENDVFALYSFDLKDNKVSDKKRLQAISKDGKILEFSTAKNVMQSTIDGFKKDLSINCDCKTELFSDCNFSDVVTASTLEKKTANFIFSISKSENFVAIFEAIKAGAKKVEENKKSTKKVDSAKDTLSNDIQKAVASALNCDVTKLLGFSDITKTTINGCKLSDIKQAINLGISLDLALSYTFVAKQTSQNYLQAVSQFAPKK